MWSIRAQLAHEIEVREPVGASGWGWVVDMSALHVVLSQLSALAVDLTAVTPVDG